MKRARKIIQNQQIVMLLKITQALSNGYYLNVNQN